MNAACRQVGFVLCLVVRLDAANAVSVGSAACGACHREIYNSYMRTPMATSSGRVGMGPLRENLDRASFFHQSSGFQYQVRRDGQRLSFGFSKNGELSGAKELSYFVGSGATARSYLIDADGFLFEAPVAYYAGGAKWDLAPGYDQYKYPYLNRPALPGCLNCHASFLETVSGTQNRFGAPPFRESGVACERCHGPGKAHISKMKSGRSEGGSDILNPSKLAADRRDSVCSQCHLSGDVRVMRAGRDWRSFQPGERLSDSMTIFVRAGASPGMKVTGHVEKLAQSACKRAAGDRLWCGSCHDPHLLPAAKERSSWFRQKCLACHQLGQCKETQPARRAKQDDCAGCHMPKNPVIDAQHVVFTDHSIPRRFRGSENSPAINADLVPFGGVNATPRDVALAYAIAGTRHEGYRQRALSLLEKTIQDNEDDTEILLYLAEIYRNTSRPELAIPRYEKAMRLDPSQVTASVGLGAIRMEQGEYAEAVRLWKDALNKNRGLQLVQLNLAMAQLRMGDRSAAKSTLERALELNPGFAPAAELLVRVQRTVRQP